MLSNAKSLIAPIALLALAQHCPAPFLAAIPAATAAGIGAVSAAVSAAGTVAGSVATAINGKRARDGTQVIHARENWAGLHSYVSKRQDEEFGTGTAWQDCADQLKGADVTFEGTGPGVILVSGIPPACMTLATVITGKFNAGNPVPQGTDSISFTGLSNEDVQAIQDALDARST
ncbi:hypothetical protein J4E93_006639 [Alternaria ventricosa]|uniref:uncharacterized protein n=1 Tax=Alternaria ventricosa TaxID=1187951 RepID=UPI0020C21FC2|nr:uncharacterized protein J4E93_006639 [Alternaria ventricosa]KAI4643628.1 hypothetical protein J4E93_006639 [Alternaria ventricosa]